MRGGLLVGETPAAPWAMAAAGQGGEGGGGTREPGPEGVSPFGAPSAGQGEGQGAVPPEALHTPVLFDEVLSFLQPQPGGRFCDVTLGMAGHASAVLDRMAPDGQLLGLDRDPEALALAQRRLAPFAGRAVLVHAPMSRLKEVLEAQGFAPVDGVLADLGVSSLQLDRAERGFSFRQAGPLDMRMDTASGETLAELLRRVSEEELTAILRDLGEERYARRVARFILEAMAAGRLATTADLAQVVARAVPRWERGKDPATRTFQALRLAVNRELDELQAFLDAAPFCLRPGGRLAVISFHSLEDRLVKHRFRALATPATTPDGRRLAQGAGAAAFRLVTKRPVAPSDEEVARNPRARSAKLRVLERI